MSMGGGAGVPDIPPYSLELLRFLVGALAILNLPVH